MIPDFERFYLYRAHAPALARRAWAIWILALTSSGLAQTIRLEDIVAGGDGSGNAPAANVGIDPRSGQFSTDYFAGPISDSDGVNPAPVPGSPFIDSVFLLKGRVPTDVDGCGGCYVQYLTQSGVQAWLADSEESNRGWNLILKNRVGGVSEPGILVGGQDGFETSIGLHASMGITFDLEQIRSRHGASSVGCFSTFWGMDACSTGFVTLLAMLSNDTSGVLDAQSQAFSAGGGAFLRMEIPPQARYLTLATLATGTDACDHGTFARPVISPLPCPAPALSWVWSLSRWRVPPTGGQIDVNGEMLDDTEGDLIASRFRLNSSFLTDIQIQPTFRRLAAPALAPGFYDLEFIGQGSLLIQRLPRAIEVALPPTLTSFAPSHVLSDRATVVEIFGQNLRSDMAIELRHPGGDGPDLRIQGLSILSENHATGTIPRSEEAFFGPGPGGPPTQFVPIVQLYDQSDFPQFFDLVTCHRIGISGVSPSLVSTEGGTPVAFEGLNFAAGMQFQLGAVPVSSLQIIDSSHAQGISPPLPGGIHAASLLSPSGQLHFTLEKAISAIEPGPLTIEGVDPARVLSLGGTRVTVVTTRSHGGGTPRVNGAPLSNVEVVDARTLRGEIEPLPPGRYDVDIVDASDVVVASAPGALDVVADTEISITSVTPAVVSTLGGTEVTFKGSGFSPGFVPRIGGEPLQDVTVDGSSQMRGLSPILDPGVKDASIGSNALELARRAGAVTAVAPDIAVGMFIGHVRPARITRNVSRVRFVGAQLAGDLIPRIGGQPLVDANLTSPCRFEGAAPNLPPGLYKADLFRPGFGVVATLDELVEVANPGAPPRPQYIVSEPVTREGAGRLFVFGNDFSSSTVITIGDKPLLNASVVSDELIVGNAPPLDAAEAEGLRDVVAEDERGSASLPGGFRYVEAEGDTGFVRGDPNGSGRIDLSDAVYILGYLFLGNPTSLACLDAADVDSSSDISLTDAIFLLHYLFLGGRQPPAPFPECNRPVEPGLGCSSFAACGAGGGGANPNFQDNVKLVEQIPSSAADPVVVEIAAEEGEIVIHDPPGGKEIGVGDVIAGFTPIHSDAIHNGVAYMLKVEAVISGSCLSAGAGDKVFKTSLATLADLLKDGDVFLKQDDFWGAKVNTYHKPNCNILVGGGASADMGGGGVGDGVFFDVDIAPFTLLDAQSGDSRVRAGFYQGRIRYNSGINLGLGIGGSKLARLTFFAGMLLDSAVEFYVDASVSDRLKKDIRVLHLEKGTVIFIGPVPLLLTAGIDLYAGVDLQGGATIYLDVGAQANFKAGLGFEVSGGGFKNLSGFEPPSLTSLPNTPVFEVNGSAQARAYIRPQVSISGGLLIKVVSAELSISSEISGSAHVQGSNNPPCFNWSLDAGARIDLGTLIEIFGFDVLKLKANLFDETWPDILSGRVGCRAKPIVVVKHRLEPTATGMMLHLDASESYDPDGGPLRFLWDFNNDGECIRDTGTDPRTTFFFTPARDTPCWLGSCTHVVRVRVTDDENTSVERNWSFKTANNQETLIQIPPRRL